MRVGALREERDSDESQWFLISDHCYRSVKGLTMGFDHVEQPIDLSKNFRNVKVVRG